MESANDIIIAPFKDRVLDKTKPIRVYRNLNKKGKWYSLVQGGKTMAHATAICLMNCIFYVNENARQRIVKNRRKEFHAYIEGYYNAFATPKPASYNLPEIIKYNPYIDKKFTRYTLESDLRSVTTARSVACGPDGIRAYGLDIKF